MWCLWPCVYLIQYNVIIANIHRGKEEENKVKGHPGAALYWLFINQTVTGKLFSIVTQPATAAILLNIFTII